MILTRDRGNRMWGGEGVSGGGGGGVSSSQLAGMLIGYATETWVDEHYISIDFFSRLFQAHGTENGSEIDVMPNDMETVITSVESMFGFWTNLYISALGSNGAAPAGISLGMLTDVNISGTPSAGQVLTFDAVSGKWVNGNATGASSLATLTDVTLTSLQNGQTLLYDSTTSKWYNSALKTINGQSLLGSGDISVGGGASGNYLPLSGGTIVGVVNFTTGSNIIFNGTHNTSPQYVCTFIDNRSDRGIAYSAVEDLNLDSKYLPLTGGTMTGTINTTVGETCFKIITGYYSAIRIASSPSSQTTLADINFFADSTFSSTGGNINIYGVNGVSIGAWNNPVILVKDGFVDFKGAGGTNAANNSGFRIGMLTNYPDNIYLQFSSTVVGLQIINNAWSESLLKIENGGNIGIGTASPSYKLHVAGTIYATGSITALSDARKKDITGEAGVTVEQIAHAPAVQFLWKDKERRKDGQQVGTLAQYWQAVLPEVVMDKGGELSMQYGVAALVSAIVTARRVVDHERRIHELEKENERLKEEIEQIRLN